MKSMIDGVRIKVLRQFDDRRGWLIELFREDEIDIENYPVMSYISCTHPGVVRGPHEHIEQSDYFCFIGPSNFRLYLWDNRPRSRTFGIHFTLDVGAKNKTSVIIPPGVVHAYKNIGTEEGIVYNAPNRLYAGNGRNEPVDETRHEDDPNSKFKIAD